MTSPLAAPPAAAAVGPPAVSFAERWHNFKPFGADGFNFRDVLDLVNPIQHVPILGNIWRAATGDVASPLVRIAGGALFGGPLGAAFAAASVFAHQTFSSDPDVTGIPEPPALDHAPDTAIAAHDPAAAAQTEARGGWMVAQTRQVPISSHGGPAATAPAPRATDVAGREPRRGGWMVQAAYAANEVVQPARGRSTAILRATV